MTNPDRGPTYPAPRSLPEISADILEAHGIARPDWLPAPRLWDDVPRAETGGMPRAVAVNDEGEVVTGQEAVTYLLEHGDLWREPPHTDL